MAISPAELQALTPAEVQKILDGPSAKPPPGVERNLVNPQNWDTIVLLTIILCSVFSTVAVAIRCYTKFRIVRKWGWEDYALVLGWLFTIAEMVLLTMSHYQGHGVHQWNLSVREFEKLLYWVNLATIIYNPAVFFTKLSILLLYVRVFVHTRKGNPVVYFGAWALILSNFICYTIDTFFTIFICTPREKIWNVLYVGGHCFEQNKSIEALGIFNAISDFVMLFLPVVSIWKLQLSRRRKLGLIGIFGIGFLGCLTSIIRTYYTFKMVHNSDVSWNINAMGCWCSAETAIGLICASLPVCPKFFQRMRENWTKLSTRTGTTSIRLSTIPGSSKPRSTGKVTKSWDDDSCLRSYDMLEETGDGFARSLNGKAVAQHAAVQSSTV